ncbi:unnamed protein product [Trichogramma brassicae]|uniref:RNA-directed DNA polymerase n=1 Tax=Trichogramma brassicae TaxID=86971 RepID=A0A6H5IVC1_9HYME|nr:unnamed protein product [Trichogramma brassicae]
MPAARTSRERVSIGQVLQLWQTGTYIAQLSVKSSEGRAVVLCVWHSWCIVPAVRQVRGVPPVLGKPQSGRESDLSGAALPQRNSTRSAVALVHGAVTSFDSPMNESPLSEAESRETSNLAEADKRRRFASTCVAVRSRDSLREVDAIVSSARSSDTRKYVSIALGGNRYSALLDPGATSSLIHERVADRFRKQMRTCGVFVRSAMCEVSKAIGTLAADMKIEGFQSRLNFRVMPVLDEDVILGIDFCHDFDVDTRWRRGVWRVREGPWRPFLCNDDRAMRESCAGITVTNEEQLAEVNQLVEEVLAPQTRLADGLHPMTNLVEHHIRLTDETPIKHKLRRMTEPMLWEARNTVTKWYQEGIIEPSASDFRSAPVLVKKSDGGYRMCIDFRDLNARTVKDAYPEANMDMILDRLRNARFISTIDLKAAFLQVPLNKESRKYTAFAVPGSGLWQFLRMPYGLSNSPSTFSRLVDALFGPAYEPHVFAYLDDVIVVTDTFADHLKWLKFALSRLVDAGLQINREKCHFCRPRVLYLGFQLDHEGLRPDPERIQPVVNYPAPTNVKQLRRFLGMVGWYARFIARDSEIKAPLTKLLKKKRRSGSGARSSRRLLRGSNRHSRRRPVLARPDFSKPFKVQCDASGVAVGAVLTQEQQDGEHPIVYASRSLTGAERNYSTTEKECLAVLWSIRKFRPYIEGYRFVVITDHSALKWLRNLKDPTGRLARWALEMQQWDFVIEHRKGALHHLPDALSRVFTDEDGEVRVCSTAEIVDEWYLRMLEEVEKHPARYPQWRVDEGRLYRFKRNSLLDPVAGREGDWKLVVPEEWKERILRDSHNEPATGHLGVEKTYDRVAQEYFWRGCYHDVEEYVRKCDLCQRHKVSQQKKQGLMGKRVVEEPWTVVAADLMEFPPSKARNKYLIVFQDLFTRWVEMKPVRKADGKSVARAFEELVLFRWGAPLYFLSDNGREFDNKLVSDMLNGYGIKRATTPPYHPQSNPVERSNRTLKTVIKMYVNSDHRTWDTYIHEFRHALNTAVQSTLKVSPSFLNFGRQPRPIKSLRRELEGAKEIEAAVTEYWLDRLTKLECLRELVAKYADEAHDRQRMENKAAENVQHEAPILALDSGVKKVASVENLPPPELNSSESSLVATIDDVWGDIVATIAEDSGSPVVVVTAENEEKVEKVGATVELVEPGVMAPSPNEQATSGGERRDEPEDGSVREQVPPQAPMLEQPLEQQQQVPLQDPLLDQQLEQQQQVPPQAPMLEQPLEQQQQVPLQDPLLDQQIEQQQLQVQLQEPMEVNGDVTFKKRKRGCRGGRKKKPSSNRQLTVDDVELSFDVPPRDDEEAGPPIRRQAVGESVPVYVPPGAAGGVDSIAGAGALASPKQQLPVCPSAKERSYCYNCGRDGVDMADCPRCSGAHAEWLERTYSAERSQATEERRRESWREANPDRVVSEPRRVDFDLRERLEQRLEQRRGMREAGPSSRLASGRRRQDVQHLEEARNPAPVVEAEAQADDRHATLLEILRRLDGLPDDVRIIAAMRSLFN